MAVGSIPIACSDEALLKKAVAGDRGALDELFARYRLVAYRVAHRLLGNEADALDAVQEAFIKALVHLPSFQGRSSFKTWMLRVVSNAALDLGRQRGRHNAVSLDGMPANYREECEPLLPGNANRELERQDLRHKIYEALEKLPLAQRQTFVLHAEAELSYREVAETLGISIGTVMSRLYYARLRLRELLEPWMKNE
jgi:RNA polymerase sigma-70 factor, ECF subfamily